MNQFEKMNEDLTGMVPREMASAVNLMAHPLAGVAAISALGLGLASHAFGVWMGALSGAADASQRLFQPDRDEVPGDTHNFADAPKTPATKARAATKILIADAKSFATDVTETALRITDRADDAQVPAAAATAAVAPNEAPAPLMPEDFRQPKAMDKPDAPDDLKAISGIGPKLEKVLNGLGIWSFAQIAAWTAEEIAWVDDYLSFRGRIGRDEWIGQAAKLAARAEEK